MSSLSVNTTFGVQFTKDEFRLVCLALSGKIIPKSKDDLAAKKLSVTLLSQRTHEFEQALSVSKGALDKATEEHGEEIDDYE